MPTVLIPPDNRLLGWSLADLTLYGAQPTTDMRIGQPIEAAATDPAVMPLTGNGPTSLHDQGPVEAERAADETVQLFDQSASPAQLVPPAPVVLPIGQAATDMSAPPLSVTAPGPLGSGAVGQQPAAIPLTQGTEPDAGHVPSADGSDLATPPLAVAALPDIGMAAAEAAIASHLGAIDPATTVDTLIATLPATEMLIPGVDAAGMVEAALDPSIASFAGSDPAAGLQTLIGMVDSIDAYDLTTTNISDVSDPGQTGSILDALAADEALPALLGDDGDAGSHLLDDHGIHLGG